MSYKAVEDLQPIDDYIIVNNRTQMVVNVVLHQDGIVELATYDKRARQHDMFCFPYGVILKLDARKDYQ